MSDRFCLPKTHFLIIFCILIGTTAFYLNSNKNREIQYNQMLLNKISQLTPPQQINSQPVNKEIINSDIIKNNDNSFIEKRKILEYRDAEVKYNDFKPPERRVPEHVYPSSEVKQIINIPTRGYPDNYQLMGVLLRENTETAFNLFGRQTYPGSNQYEYYAQGTMHNNNVKLPINSKGGRELYDGDEVRIPGTDGDKGLFKVKLYQLDNPRYNPFVL